MEQTSVLQTPAAALAADHSSEGSGMLGFADPTIGWVAVILLTTVLGIAVFFGNADSTFVLRRYLLITWLFVACAAGTCVHCPYRSDPCAYVQDPTISRQRRQHSVVGPHGQWQDSAVFLGMVTELCCLCRRLLTPEY